jgi:hypothetical protein
MVPLTLEQIGHGAADIQRHLGCHGIFIGHTPDPVGSKKFTHPGSPERKASIVISFKASVSILLPSFLQQGKGENPVDKKLF